MKLLCREKTLGTFFLAIGDGSFVPLFEHFVLFCVLGELKILHLRNTKQQVKSAYFSKEISLKKYMNPPYKRYLLAILLLCNTADVILYAEFLSRSMRG